MFILLYCQCWDLGLVICKVGWNRENGTSIFWFSALVCISVRALKKAIKVSKLIVTLRKVYQGFEIAWNGNYIHFLWGTSMSVIELKGFSCAGIPTLPSRLQSFTKRKPENEQKIRVSFSFMEIFKKEYGWELADPLCQVYYPQVGTVWQQANYGAVTRMIFIPCLPWNQSGAAHQSLIFFSLISSPGLAFCSILIFL